MALKHSAMPLLRLDSSASTLMFPSLKATAGRLGDRLAAVLRAAAQMLSSSKTT